MITLLEITTLILILACLGLLFLNKANSEDITEQEEAIKRLSVENDQMRIKLKILEKKIIKLSEPLDKVEIVHKYDDEDAPGYKNF